MAIALFPDCQSFFSHTLALASAIFLEPVLKDMRKKRERNEKEARKKRERSEKRYEKKCSKPIVRRVLLGHQEGFARILAVLNFGNNTTARERSCSK
jgi:hypothetical protein